MSALAVSLTGGVLKCFEADIFNQDPHCGELSGIFQIHPLSTRTLTMARLAKARQHYADPAAFIFESCFE